MGYFQTFESLFSSWDGTHGHQPSPPEQENVITSIILYTSLQFRLYKNLKPL